VKNQIFDENLSVVVVALSWSEAAVKKLVIVGEEKEVFEVFGLGPVSHCGPTKF
jgi:hypothetical protein